MTFFALHDRVLSAQRKSSGVVIGSNECCLLESVYIVATLAFAAIGTFHELSIVRIGFVTISALLMHNFCLEVAGVVTRTAVKLYVLAAERIVGLVVIEFRGEGGLLPCNRAVAR